MSRIIVGRYRSSPPTLADGRHGVVLLDANGRVSTDVGKIAGVTPQMDDTDKLAVSMYMLGSSVAGDKPVQSVATSGDGNSGVGIVTSGGYWYNSATWDRQRGNIEAVALASAARTAQADSSDITNHNAKYLQLFFDCTVDPSTAAVTPTIQVKDSIGGLYHTVWTAVATVAAVGTTVYSLGPGLLASVLGGQTDAENILIPRTFRVRVTVADSASLTYSVQYALIN